MMGIKMRVHSRERKMWIYFFCRGKYGARTWRWFTFVRKIHLFSPTRGDVIIFFSFVQVLSLSGLAWYSFPFTIWKQFHSFESVKYLLDNRNVFYSLPRNFIFFKIFQLFIKTRLWDIQHYKAEAEYKLLKDPYESRHNEDVRDNNASIRITR